MAEPPDPRAIAVLVADDDPTQRLLVEEVLRSAPDVDHRVTCVPDGRSALDALCERVFDVALLDLSMPGLDGLEVMRAVADDPTRPQVIFVSGHGTVGTATAAMKLGAYDFVEKPIDAQRLLTLVWKAAEARRIHARSARLEAVVRRDTDRARIVTRDPRMHQALALLERVAPSDVSVLIVGESGTGKELVARELHRLSGRDPEPLVALNCAAVSESLAESELFGHEKGAFTGAGSRKIGLVEMADGGTLFLDEIGDLAPPLQAKLLRALESRHFRRVGGLKELPANFRLVSATHAPLQTRVKEGTFRGDLYYRINAIVIELPPLRERPGDILVLARHFLGLAGLGDSGEWTLSEDAQRMLQSYPWPGNVRELRNVMERAALLSRDHAIRAADLGTSLGGADAVAATEPEPPLTSPSAELNLESLERGAVAAALERTGWHQGRAAELLGISVRTLYRKIRAYGLRRPDVDREVP